MRALFVVLVILIALGLGMFLAVSPQLLAQADLPNHQADAANGERMFNAAGCSSCHAAPGAKNEETLKLVDRF